MNDLSATGFGISEPVSFCSFLGGTGAADAIGIPGLKLNWTAVFGSTEGLV